MGKIRIGVSGWSYEEWRGSFYPEGLSHDEELAYSTARFDTIEINGTFYGLTDPGTCRHWYRAAPGGFRYAIKGSRYITHNKRLKDPRSALANFWASGVLELGDKMGPVLWQLPPRFRFDAGRLERFLDLLPTDTSSAAKLARDHDDRVKDVSYGRGANHRIRNVLEIRHESFLQPETARIARRHGIALCFSHSTEWPYVEEVTAGFVYIRLHGPGELYAGKYGDEMLGQWAERILKWQRGGEPEEASRISPLTPPRRKERDVYVYFDNTAAGHAPVEALRLRSIIDAE